MKRILLFLALCLSVNAFAVDITITVTAGEAAHFQAAVGKAKGLVDNAVPPQPRSATAAEAKQFLIDKAKQLVVDTEGKVLMDAAAATVPAFNPQ